jgi:hypothetical protein
VDVPVMMDNGWLKLFAALAPKNQPRSPLRPPAVSVVWLVL